MLRVSVLIGAQPTQLIILPFSCVTCVHQNVQLAVKKALIVLLAMPTLEQVYTPI